MELFKTPSPKDFVLPSEKPTWNAGTMIYASLKR
jgi:hypothetical protein